MSNRETENQRNGETDGTNEKEDVPPLAASVKTLREAVQLSLKDGLSENSVFIFARALKAFEITHNRRLPPTELQSAFSLWWNAAKPFLPPDADFDEWRFDFETTFAKTNAALGSNSLEEAVRRADAQPPPPQASRYVSPKLKRLVAVCYHLQRLQGKSPFFISVRDAAKITSAKGLSQATAWLAGLVRDGILAEIEKGTGKRATRFRFNLAEPTPAGETGVSTSAQASQHHVSGKSSQSTATAMSKQASIRAVRKPTTYELAERRKALKELMKALGSGGDLEGDDCERYEKCKRELAKVNLQLAGMAG